MSDSLYFRQLLAGRQVAVNHPVAGQMANFMYLIGDPASQGAMAEWLAGCVAEALAVLTDASEGREIA